MNPKVDAFLKKAKTWREESAKLRTILLAFPLTEELKWGEPCYTSQGHNVVLIGGFKDYVTLLFFKGALLKDPHGLLVAPGRTQAGRQIRFTSLKEIVDLGAQAEDLHSSGHRGRKSRLESGIEEALRLRNSGRAAKETRSGSYPENCL